MYLIHWLLSPPPLPLSHSRHSPLLPTDVFLPYLCILVLFCESELSVTMGMELSSRDWWAHQWDHMENNDSIPQYPINSSPIHHWLLKGFILYRPCAESRSYCKCVVTVLCHLPRSYFAAIVSVFQLSHHFCFLRYSLSLKGGGVNVLLRSELLPATSSQHLAQLRISSFITVYCEETFL